MNNKTDKAPALRCEAMVSQLNQLAQLLRRARSELRPSVGRSDPGYVVVCSRLISDAMELVDEISEANHVICNSHENPRKP